MNGVLQAILGALLFWAGLYVSVRIVFSAYFKAKREHQKVVLHDLKQGS